MRRVEHAYRRGTECPQSVLTDEDVRLIRALRPRLGRKRRGELSISELCEKFGASYKAVWSVINYDTWKHVRD